MSKETVTPAGVDRELARDRIEDVLLHVNMARAFAHSDEIGDVAALARVLVSLSDAVSLLAEIVREGARK